MLKVAIMLLSPQKYLFSIEIEISAIVLVHFLLFSLLFSAATKTSNSEIHHVVLKRSSPVGVLRKLKMR